MGGGEACFLGPSGDDTYEDSVDSILLLQHGKNSNLFMFSLFGSREKLREGIQRDGEKMEKESIGATRELLWIVTENSRELKWRREEKREGGGRDEEKVVSRSSSAALHIHDVCLSHCAWCVNVCVWERGWGSGMSWFQKINYHFFLSCLFETK